MSRMAEIKELEKLIFGKEHKSGIDYNFIYLDDFLSENFFGKKSLEWMVDKAHEEANEVKEVFDQLTYEFTHNMLQEETIEHFIEEVGDFILASASVMKCTGGDVVSILHDIDIVIRNVHYINDLLMAKADEVVNADNVFASNKGKIEEYFAAVKAYDELIQCDPVTTNILVKLAKRLYTRAEYCNPDNKAKIIKELRRMRFAIVSHNKLMDV